MIYVYIRTKTGSKKGTIMSADVKNMDTFMYEWENLISDEPSYIANRTLRRFGNLIGTNGVFVDYREVVIIKEITPEGSLDSKRFSDELWRRYHAEKDPKKKAAVMQEIQYTKNSKKRDPLHSDNVVK